MNRTLLLVTLSRAVATSVALVACTTSTPDNFTNPPSGPPASCTTVAAIAGCTEGSTSYACTSGRPDDGDTNLVCDDGVADVDGATMTLFCCAPFAQWASSCTPSPGVVGCGESSIGFACTGAVSPDEADTSLACSAAMAAGNGGNDYCCIPFDPTSGVCRCASFDEGTGTCGAMDVTSNCAAGAIAFSCASGHTPAEVNPLLVCPASDGGASYCCTTP